MAKMDKIISDIIEFRNSRGWEKNDNPKSLAKSIAIESAELLTNFQWGEASYSFENIKDEIADILIYTLALSYDLNLDFEELIYQKLQKNSIKYPKSK